MTITTTTAQERMARAKEARARPAGSITSQITDNLLMLLGGQF